jgi:hypothetical protein
MQAVWTRNGKDRATAEDRCCGDRCSEPPECCCGYVDLWGWKCDARSCVGHSYEVDGTSLCATHVSLCLAYGGNADRLQDELEDLYDQTPTLLRWMTRGLDAQVREMLCPEVPSDVILDQEVIAGKSAKWKASWRSPVTNMAVRLSLGGSTDPRVYVCERDRQVLFFTVPANVAMAAMTFHEIDPDADVREAILDRIRKPLVEVNAKARMVELAGRADLVNNLAPAV